MKGEAANPLKHALRNCSQHVPLKQHVFKKIYNQSKHAVIRWWHRFWIRCSYSVLRLSRAQAISKWYRKTQVWHWGTLSKIPSPSLAIYLWCVELIDFTCCVLTMTYHFLPCSWNSQCPAPTGYFSSGWGRLKSVPREQTASFIWRPSTRRSSAFAVSSLNA